MPAADSLTVTAVTVNPTIDVSLAVDHLVPDHKLAGHDHRREPGGGGVNVSRVIRKLGGEVRCILAVAGRAGDELIEMLSTEGLDLDALQIDGCTRESLAIEDRATTHQYRVVLDGPAVADDQHFFRQLVDFVGSGEAIVLSGLLLPGLNDDFYADVLRHVKPSISVVDIPGEPLRSVLKGHATLVKPSERELQQLAGRPLGGVAELTDAAREMLALGAVEWMLISIGAEGAILVPNPNSPSTKAGCALLFTPPFVDSVSTVGAGDTLVGALLHRLLVGDSMEEAARFGVGAATASVTVPGTGIIDATDAVRMATKVVTSRIR